MASRPALWCPQGTHQWERIPPVLMHVPDGPVSRELYIRVCTQCGLAEAMHLLRCEDCASLVTYEHWFEEPAGPGMRTAHRRYNPTAEQRSWC